ncbi:MAG: GNAT family N-acetyltransferase [Bacillota bacterium]|nr:GNAT family N-acetyltransferase [Bacillota bacterium]
MITRCQPKFVPQVARLFCIAFSDSIGFFAADTPEIREAAEDVFGLLMNTYNDSFFVAVDAQDRIAGYIVVTDSIKRLWLKALTGGYAFRAAGKFLAGRYGIGMRSLYRMALNKLFYIRFNRSARGSGQVLSVAVHPDCRSMGIGKQLIERGLACLKEKGVNTVKLEVRPGNMPALRLYQGFGFGETGRMKDLQGEWIVMELPL